MRIRKHLSASGLFRLMREGFDEIKEHRAENIQISLRDALMSAFAMFSLTGLWPFSKIDFLSDHDYYI